jgi:hypothetical protein
MIDESADSGSGSLEPAPEAPSDKPRWYNALARQGRTLDGRYTLGHKETGAGNPEAKRIAELKKVFRRCVTNDDVRAVVKSLVKAAKRGDVAAIKLFLDRTLGKQPITLEGDDGGPLEIVIRHTLHRSTGDANSHD